jgi:multiple sugar transport system permease protein
MTSTHPAAPQSSGRAGWLRFRLIAPTLQQRDSLFGYLLIAPQVFGFLIFVLIPLIAVFAFSLQDRNLLLGTEDPVGLRNYIQLFSTDPLFPVVLRNTLIFTVGLVPLNVSLALLLALALNTRMRGSTVFRAIFFAPVITSGVAWAIVWRFMLQGDDGMVNQVLAVVGVNGPNWLFEPGPAMAAVIVTRVLKNVGLNMIIFLAALQNIPRELTEASSIDGANPRQTFRRITLPLLAPTLFVAVLVTFIGSLQVFDHIALLTEGGPANATMVLIYYIYYVGFRLFDIGYASALAVILFFIALFVTIAFWFSRRVLVFDER